MVKSLSNEKIEEEEYSIEHAKEEIKDLKKKWIKLPSTLRYMEFLENYIKEKEKFIKKIREFKLKKQP